jgi:hypothetical protein
LKAGNEASESLSRGSRLACLDANEDRRKQHMEENKFEGTLVLEKLAAIGKVDEFFEAVDEDNFGLAEKLMRAAKIDSATIALVLRKMAESDGDH